MATRFNIRLHILMLCHNARYLIRAIHLIGLSANMTTVFVTNPEHEHTEETLNTGSYAKVFYFVSYCGRL